MDFTTSANPTYPDKNEAIAAIGLVFAKHTLSETPDTLQAGKNRFFLKPGWNEITEVKGSSPTEQGDSSKIAFRGYSFTVRPAMGSLLLNFNTAMSLFHKPMTVAEYIGLSEERNVDDLVGVRVWLDLERRCTDKAKEAAFNTPQGRTTTISESSTQRAGQEPAYMCTYSAGQPLTWTVWQHMSMNYASETKGGKQS